MQSKKALLKKQIEVHGSILVGQSGTRAMQDFGVLLQGTKQEQYLNNQY